MSAKKSKRRRTQPAGQAQQIAQSPSAPGQEGTVQSQDGPREPVRKKPQAQARSTPPARKETAGGTWAAAGWIAAFSLLLFFNMTVQTAPMSLLSAAAALAVALTLTACQGGAEADASQSQTPAGVAVQVI